VARSHAEESPAPEGAVVQVVGTFPPDLGGTEKVAERLAVSLAARHRVVVVTSRSEAGGSPDDRRRYPETMLVSRLATWRVAQIPFMPMLLWRLVRLPRPRLYHLHLAQAYVPEMAGLAARITRRPLVIHFHLDVEPSTVLGPIFSVYKRAVMARVLRSAERVIALNEAQVLTLTGRYGVRRDRIRVIPNGVPITVDEGSPAPEHDEAGPLRLLFVGRLSPQKNLSRLLAAMSLVSEPVELDIVGDGTERRSVEDEVARRQLTNVRLLGARHDEALMDCYRRAQALVLTSDHEGMPLVLLEAMAAGLPVVATDVPGVGETLERAGLLVSPDPAAVAEAIDRLARDPELRAKLSRLGRERAAACAWPATVEAVERVYAELGA
jgi:glycosyltransferase involved in cell wall biosynthesis